MAHPKADSRLSLKWFKGAQSDDTSEGEIFVSLQHTGNGVGTTFKKGG